MERYETEQTERTPVVLSSIELTQAVQRVRASGPASLEDDILPPPGDPQRLPALLAILRADLDTGSSSARRRLREYTAAFPELNADPHASFAMDAMEQHSVEVDTPPPFSPLKLPSEPPPPVKSEIVPAIPELTEDMARQHGFANLELLGKGGFGSVYLATQPGLGHRPVAIKYTVLPSRESQVLAALHHPNIVPVLSVHEQNGARVFCMPYHGRHTLADVLTQIDRTKSLPATGAGFLSTVGVGPETPAPRPLSVGEPQLVTADEDQWRYYETDLQRLGRLSYVDSVVMGMTRLADALAHAHGRRVIHLDIKPANILITDDGVFMILDFGLAHQNGVGPECRTGGTMRYMAPEQLAQFIHGAVRPDVRMDLYALGLVFYELLTGRHPYAGSMTADVPLHKRIAARQAAPPSVRTFNPAVSPAVEAIVLKLLQPDRAKRYLSAEHLLADLTRHQQNLPLLYAANPSLAERASKFRRRHPVVLVAAAALLLGLIAVAAIGIAGKMAERAEQARALTEAEDAIELAEKLRGELDAIRVDAGSIERPATRAAALARIAAWWDEYGVNQPGWERRPGFARLQPAQQNEVRMTLAELALLAAHAERVNATGRKPQDGFKYLDYAIDWNQRAAAALGGRPPPRVLGEQQAELHRLRGRPAVASQEEPAAESNIDLYLRGLRLVLTRDYQPAADTFERVIAADPHHAAGQFALGFVCQKLGLYADAAERFQVAKALAKHDPRPAFNRGAVLITMNRNTDAVGDLTTAIERDPGMAEAYVQRAEARGRLSDPAAALADLEDAIRLSKLTYRLCSKRIAFNKQLGNETAVMKDEATLATLLPVDELDHLARGQRAWENKKYTAAAADYRVAADLNPLNVAAWLGLSACSSESGDAAGAAEAMAAVVRILPGQPIHKYNLAVLLARLGKEDEAVRELNVVPPADATQWYKRACVYALLFRDTHMNHRDEAIVSLRNALRGGYHDFAEMKTDPDLNNLRDVPEFDDMVNRRGRLAE